MCRLMPSRSCQGSGPSGHVGSCSGPAPGLNISHRPASWRKPCRSPPVHYASLASSRLGCSILLIQRPGMSRRRRSLSWGAAGVRQCLAAAPPSALRHLFPCGGDGGGKRKYQRYVDERTPRTVASQGPWGMISAQDLIGTSEEIAEQLYAQASFQEVDEVAFALPFSFEREDYVQILTETAARWARRWGGLRGATIWHRTKTVHCHLKRRRRMSRRGRTCTCVARNWVRAARKYRPAVRGRCRAKRY